MLAAYGVLAAYVFGLLMNLWGWPFLPGVRDLEAGWRIIIATCVAAGIGASVLPVAEPGAPGQGAAP